MSDGGNPYPGALASPSEVLQLATEYHAAAQLLATRGRRGHPISRAPFRQAAIHAVELYLNAFLLHSGLEHRRVRALHHDLAARTELSLERGLQLRMRTATHLRSMATAREYLVSRYGPELTSSLSQLNRLSATLTEVASKVGPIIAVLPTPNGDPRVRRPERLIAVNKPMSGAGAKQTPPRLRIRRFPG